MYGGFPVGGVLTSVEVETQGDAADIIVSLLRKTADPTASTATFLSVGQVTIPVPAELDWSGRVTTVATRIPVLSGDRFAATTAVSETRYLDDWSAAELDYCFYSGSPNPVGSSVTYASNACNNYIPLVRGVIEPDADGDGYGDETQDLCPSDATRQTACVSAAPPAAPANVTITAVKSKARTASSATRSFVIRNSGGTAAPLVAVSVKSSRSVKNLKIVKGCKPGRIKSRCTLASLAPGASVTIKVTLSIKSATKTTLTATAGAASAKSTVKLKRKKK